MRRTILIFSFAFIPSLPVLAAEVSFSRDVRRILADKCYACHGPDEQQRQGGDASQGGLHFDTKEGAFADLGGTFAIVPHRPEQSELIRRIRSRDPDEVMPPADQAKQLSETEKQVLYQWIQQGAEWEEHWAYMPPTRRRLPVTGYWPRNFIDSFVLARLETQDITPAREADLRTLVRRLSFDLLGLPPDPAEVDRLIADPSPDAYHKLVDRFLASPHYGERMAAYWLDLVRYADSVGYHGDQPVGVSPYRDYVIEAFNRNLPFDRFTREQVAGDLLKEPTTDQLIASGYNRLGMMSAEGGVQPKEYLAKYASDRVRTASSVWLGSTLGCSECHDHKFDPFTSEDFYRFAAFFSDIQEKGLYAGAHASGDWGPKIDLPNDQLPQLLKPIDQELESLRSELEKPTATLAVEQRRWESELAEASPASQGRAGVRQPILAILELDPRARSEKQARELAGYFRSIAPSTEEIRKKIQALEDTRDKVKRANSRSSLITVSVQPRPIRVLPRGNWMHDTGPVVTPGVPHFLPQITAEGRATRDDLAQWLTSGDNPLTARVFVNRLWKLFFGAGLSKVLDDLGTQGDPPSHPALLDALAVEFSESGWDVKHVVRMIVTSSTYRQSSLEREALAQRDPYNRLLARQTRFRLEAEMIRDNALAVSGLLVRRIGGASTKPYQPEGLYRHLNFPARKYEHDIGENQYRRGVYTHWQRQFLHPAMKAFDAPPREECTVERPRSNTPLAALVLLNDPSYVEAARALAGKMMSRPNRDPDEVIDWTVRRALSREATEKERWILKQLWRKQLEHYQKHQGDAQELASVGLLPVPDDLDVAELAAWTSVARTIFNMHEFVTRN